MLQVHKSTSLTRDDLLVVYGANPGAVIAAIVELALARDPRGPLPPASNKFWTQPTALMKALYAAQEIQDTWFRARTAPSDKPMRIEEMIKDDDSVIASQWLAIGNALPAQVGPLLRAPLSNMGSPRSDGAPFSDFEPSLTLLRGRMAKQTAAGAVSMIPSPWVMGSWPAGPGSYSMALDGASLFDGPADQSAYDSSYGVAFALVALRLAYPRLRATAYLAGEIETPPGVDKQTYPLLERAARLSTCVRLLMDQPRLLELRSRVRFCLHPNLAVIRDALGSDKREALESLGARVLAEPLHPWFAEAERLLLPAPRLTRWSTSSPTLGLISSGALSYVRKAAGKSGATMAHRLIGGSLFGSTLRDLQNWALFQAELDEGGRKAGAVSTLGLEGMKAPLSLHLYGQTFSPIVTDGMYASESVSDVLEYLVRTPVALREAAGGSMLSQPLSLYYYRAPGTAQPEGASELHMNRHSYWEPGRLPPLFIEPLQPELDPRGGLGDISPDMVLPMVDSQYWGEADAIWGPYTPEGVASLLALEEGQAAVVNHVGGKAVSVKNGYEHLFKVDAAGNVVKAHPEASHVFYSTRTRRPWLNRVDLSRNVVPVLTVAISATTSPVELPIETAIAIDEEPVSTSVPLGTVAEAYVDRLLQWSR